MYVIQDAAGNTEQTLRQKPYALLLLVLKLQCLWGNGLGHYASSQEFVLQKHAELMLCISISVGTLFLRSQLSNTACTPCNWQSARHQRACQKKTLLDMPDIWSYSLLWVNLDVQAAWNQCYQTQQIGAFVQTNIHTSWDLSQINFDQNQHNFCAKIRWKAFDKPQRKEKKKRPILSQLLHFLLHFATFSFQKYSCSSDLPD